MLLPVEMFKLNGKIIMERVTFLRFDARAHDSCIQILTRISFNFILDETIFESFFQAH